MTKIAYETDVAIPPGFTLEEELKARRMTRRELASRIGRPPQIISEIIHGKKAITAETALDIEAALGIPAYLWLRLEARYRLALARQRRAERR
ncbi:MAG: HigA family addiction module antidote protein [Chloroflexi bacterium]|nr:HigA family addiction module antidote protein [Chloroflexota bacterium]